MESASSAFWAIMKERKIIPSPLGGINYPLDTRFNYHVGVRIDSGITAARLEGEILLWLAQGNNQTRLPNINGRVVRIRWKKNPEVFMWQAELPLAGSVTPEIIKERTDVTYQAVRQLGQHLLRRFQGTGTAKVHCLFYFGFEVGGSNDLG